MDKLNVCVAGATGWAGSELSRGIFEAVDMELVAIPLMRLILFRVEEAEKDSPVLWVIITSV